MQDKVINKIAILCIAFLFLILFLFDVISIPCIFHKITGLYCSGCGISRMIKEIFRLNFYQAFRYNPLCFILFPLLLMYLIYSIYLWITEKEDKIIKKIDPKIIYILLIIVILFGIMRNIPMFSFLKPTKI
ncbi:MAG: DUF2752 domain-containing protein [Bacilli bacterium]|nr:DUF2752 domain-containing protein [Bacilli bacterium]